MRDILKVSPGELRTRIEAHKASGKRLSKGSSSLAPRVAAPFLNLKALDGSHFAHLAGQFCIGQSLS
jgi:hypothetical protein